MITAQEAKLITDAQKKRHDEAIAKFNSTIRDDVMKGIELAIKVSHDPFIHRTSLSLAEIDYLKSLGYSIAQPMSQGGYNITW